MSHRETIDIAPMARGDAEVRAMVDLVNQPFGDRPDKTTVLQVNLGEGLRKAMMAPWSDEQVEQVYADAYDLFQNRQYDAALPIALHLSINRPLDPRFMFMAGMILQLMGDPLLAATFFATQLTIDPNSIPAAFRLAECYAMIGETDEAHQIFETVIDMGRDVLGEPDEFFQLQRIVADKLGAMN